MKAHKIKTVLPELLKCLFINVGPFHICLKHVFLIIFIRFLTRFLDDFRMKFYARFLPKIFSTRDEMTPQC